MAEHTCGGRGAVPCPTCTTLGAQEAFVERWRAEHPDEVYDSGWRCPLCNEVVQGHETSPFYGLIEYHQRDHGEAWQAYELAAEPR
ncbi:MAG TPA: hypothetical protein VMT30_09440 [Candidatus Saccharimonadia bacterium]|nr:hypothetical protein [Candidatus Saccharimonadia bacterium]